MSPSRNRHSRSSFLWSITFASFRRRESLVLAQRSRHTARLWWGRTLVSHLARLGSWGGLNRRRIELCCGGWTRERNATWPSWRVGRSRGSRDSWGRIGRKRRSLCLRRSCLRSASRCFRRGNRTLRVDWNTGHDDVILSTGLVFLFRTSKGLRLIVFEPEVFVNEGLICETDSGIKRRNHVTAEQGIESTN